MASADGLYESARIAAGYAFARPAVHPRIIDRMRQRWRLEAPVARALDVGCGAGRSTAALQTLAREVVGVDPAMTMLAHRHNVAPGARFVVAPAERLPFIDGAFTLITAAGSINYTERELMLAEIARVLARDGTFVIYDFSAGRRIADDSRLAGWYDEFNRRYPDAPGYAMDVRRLPFGRFGLTLAAYEEFAVSIPMTADSYLRYAMSETRVELALSRGVPKSEIRRWVQAGLNVVFGDRTRDVLFDAYAACVRHQ